MNLLLESRGISTICLLTLFAAAAVFADRIVPHSNHNKLTPASTKTQSPFEDAVASKTWCHSDPELISHPFTWTISNFSLTTDVSGQSINSSTFPADSSTKSKWKLLLYPAGRYYSLPFEQRVWISLMLSEAEAPEKRVKAKMSIINHKQEAVLTEYGRYPDNFKAELLPDDKLTIQFEVYEYEGTTHNSGHVFHEPVRKSTPSENFGHLLDSGALSDVALVVARRDFKAHKSILSARSPVFKVMFTSQSNQSNRVEINDIDEPEVFEELLRYIYTGKLMLNQEQQRDLVLKLSNAAAKYQLDELTSICKHILS